MNFVKNKRRKVPSVIIVSLIDVLLVVLIFLMVSTTFKKEQPALKLALPESKVAKPGTADRLWDGLSTPRTGESDRACHK